MVRMKNLALTVLLLFAAGTCAAPQQSSLTTAEQEALSLRLSEPPGYFDTDNLISNEDSFQHVVPVLSKQVSPGGVYLGVGPAQNFTYIAHTEPQIAFIVDIRRDNLLFMFYLKALFNSSQNRWEYLSRLLGKPLESDFKPDPKAGTPELVAYFERQPHDSAFSEEVFNESWARLRQGSPRLLIDGDRSVLRKMAGSFFRSGLRLKFRSHGRASRLSYPTLERLLLETDSEGRRWHYLNTESDFQKIRSLQAKNRIIPVVGDLAGSHSLIEIGRYLETLDLKVSTFYVSNVEFYLFGQGRYRAFVRNLKGLPLAQRSALIRSYFGYGFRHPEAVDGYRVTSLVQFIPRFLLEDAKRPYRDYWDLVLRDYLEK